MQSDEEIRGRVAELADEVATGVRNGRAAEWLEEVIGSALLEVARAERQRCAAVAGERVEMGEKSVRRMGTGSWAPTAVGEARARLNEARALADALRVTIRPPGQG